MRQHLLRGRADVLAGIRVIECCEGIAGPLAGLRLAELGAEVIKVEAGAGDWTRQLEPTVGPSGTSWLFHALNRGKKSVLLRDPGAPGEFAASLAPTADVLLYDSDDEQRRGFADALLAARGDVISVSISALGEQGPLAGLAGSELTAQALAEYPRYLGSPGDPPVRVGAEIAGFATATFAVHAVLAGLLARAEGGERAHVSMLRSLVALETVQIAGQHNPDEYKSIRLTGPGDPPDRGWRTADRPVIISFGLGAGPSGRTGWEQFLDEIGASHIAEDPRYDRSGRNTTGRGDLVDEARPLYDAAFADLTADQLGEAIVRHGGSYAKFHDQAEVLAHPQTKAVQAVAAPEDEHDTPVLTFPARFSLTTPNVPRQSPRLGQHSAEFEGPQ
jgi:crotonobetainyl-CoA:carnitine CoA-transferase CaiB-like acyl-CoA transferase